jgi:hypothetical protein
VLRLSDKYTEAVIYAAEAHAGQVRKGTISRISRTLSPCRRWLMSTEETKFRPSPVFSTTCWKIAALIMARSS